MGWSTEIADEIGSQGIWGPFAVGNVAVCIDIQTISFIAPAEFLQAAFGFFDRRNPFLSKTVPVTKSIFERDEPRIQLDNTFVRISLVLLLLMYSYPCHLQESN